MQVHRHQICRHEEPDDGLAQDDRIVLEFRDEHQHKDHLAYQLDDAGKQRQPDFSLYVGPEELTGECVLLGADGGVNGGANIFPELYVAMYDAACAHDIARVREIQRRIMQISTSVYTVGKYGSSYLKGVKCALSLLGVCDDYLSYPYRKFRTEERARIRQALEALGANCNV